MYRNIKMLVLDVDGTLTDGKIYMGNTGEVMKAFDVKDGAGLCDILPQLDVNWEEYNRCHPDSQIKGIVPVIITARQSKILENRCGELRISNLYQGCRDKVNKLKEIAEEFGFNINSQGKYEELAYMGDDILDIPAMKICNIVACPIDATKKVMDISDFVASRKGGDGAVREFIEWIVEDNI